MICINKKPCAKAVIKGHGECSALCGEAWFYSENCGVLVEIKVKGLPQSERGFFALHIHEKGCCKGENLENTGGHLNLKGVPHPEHTGDLPPLLSVKGTAYMAVLTDRFTVRDIMGRSIVIHSDADDFTSQPAGNSGSKLACGVICKVS